MKTKEVIFYYGSMSKLAQALRLSKQAVYQWGEYPPLLRQYELEELTRGELKATRRDL